MLQERAQFLLLELISQAKQINGVRLNSNYYIIIGFVIIYLLIGLIRGINRYRSINKYQYDYYDSHPQLLIEKLLHHIIIETFGLTTLYISVFFMVLISIAIYVL